MKTVGTFEGKTHFSRLVGEAEAGATIIITKNGKPVAQLGPIRAAENELTPEEALTALLSLEKPLGLDLRELIDDGRRY